MSVVVLSGGIYQITFDGILVDAADISPLVADVGALVNANAMASLSVSVADNDRTSVAALVADVQTAIDNALLAAGLTPGFLVSSLISDGSDLHRRARPVPRAAVRVAGLDGAQRAGREHPGRPRRRRVQTIVAHPTNADIMWVGTVNGGIWKTVNATAAAGEVKWTPLLDAGPGMSISELALDPTSATSAILVAGVGRTSNFGRLGSERVGLYRSVDAGATWAQLGVTELAGLNVTGIVARGSIIVVATVDPNGGGRGGVWRSANTGTSFVRLSGDVVGGLPLGDAFDLTGDPRDLARLYAFVAGSGVRTSADMGVTWTPAGDRTFGTSTTWVSAHVAVGPSPRGSWTRPSTRAWPCTARRRTARCTSAS